MIPNGLTPMDEIRALRTRIAVALPEVLAKGMPGAPLVVMTATIPPAAMAERDMGAYASQIVENLWWNLHVHLVKHGLTISEGEARLLDPEPTPAGVVVRLVWESQLAATRVPLLGPPPKPDAEERGPGLRIVAP